MSHDPSPVGSTSLSAIPEARATPAGPGRAGRIALYLAAWGFFALFFASQNWLSALYAGRTATLLSAFLYPVTDAALWAVLGLVVVALAQRFPLEQRRLLRALAVHVPAALVLSLIEGGATFSVFRRIGAFAGSDVPAARLMALMMLGKLHTNLLTYAAIVGITQGIDYYRKYRERELRSSRLEAELARAELQVLKMQLHPHFLFNTLHAISTLMHRDVEAADRMLTRLGDLLRLAIADVGAQEVTLQHELEFIGRYLEIEQIRFPDRLRVSIDVAPEALDALVPSLVLQPLVENAIRYGIAPRAGGGQLEIRAGRDGTMLRLAVLDDGPGLSPESSPRTGVGIANTRARLEQLYGARHRFEMGARAEGGLAVVIVIPFQRAEERRS